MHHRRIAPDAIGCHRHHGHGLIQIGIRGMHRNPLGNRQTSRPSAPFRFARIGQEGLDLAAAADDDPAFRGLLSKSDFLHSDSLGLLRRICGRTPLGRSTNGHRGIHDVLRTTPAQPVRPRTAASQDGGLLAEQRKSAVFPTNCIVRTLVGSKSKMRVVVGVARGKARGAAKRPHDISRLRKSFDADSHHKPDALGQRHDRQWRDDAGKRCIVQHVLHPPMHISHVQVAELVQPLARAMVKERPRKRCPLSPPAEFRSTTNCGSLAARMRGRKGIRRDSSRSLGNPQLGKSCRPGKVSCGPHQCPVGRRIERAAVQSRIVRDGADGVARFQAWSLRVRGNANPPSAVDGTIAVNGVLSRDSPQPLAQTRRTRRARAIRG